MEVEPSLVLARWAYYGTAMILFGSALFPLYAGGRNGANIPVLPKSATIALAAAALVAAVTWLLSFAAELDSSEGLIETTWGILVESSFGPTWWIRLGALFIALGTALTGHLRLLATALLVALACEGWTGHAAAFGLTGSLLHSAHVISAAAWIGGIVPLARLVSIALADDRLRPAAEAALSRFSRAGVLFVAVIALTGASNIWHVHPGRLASINTYNQVLFAKLVLFVGMVGVAAFNRYHFLPQLTRSSSASTLPALSRSIALEQAIGLAVLLDVSALGLINPDP